MRRFDDIIHVCAELLDSNCGLERRLQLWLLIYDDAPVWCDDPGASVDPEPEL